MSPSSVLITGANRGIGLEFVRQYAQLQNCPHVFAGCRSPDTAKVSQLILQKMKEVEHITLTYTGISLQFNVFLI